MIETFRKKMAETPEYPRFVPFFIFLVLTFVGGTADGDAKFTFYTLKVFVGAWLVWEMRKVVAEMRWVFSWEAVVVGVAVFVVWVGLDPYYPKNHILMKDTPESIWNPFARFGDDSLTAWMLFLIRVFGMTIIVPPLEEVFYRSLAYRYLIRYEFEKVPFTRFDGVAFVAVALMFGFVHFQWIPGIICAMAYQWLVLRKNRLGDAMTAHAITNFMLAIYVLVKDAWKFF